MLEEPRKGLASKALVEDGNRVALLGRNPESLKIALAELGLAIGLAGDGVDPKSTEALLKMTPEAWGKLDGLYHVAGGSGRSKGMVLSMN